MLRPRGRVVEEAGARLLSLFVEKIEIVIIEIVKRAKTIMIVVIIVNI